MEILKVTIEIAVDENDAGAQHAKDVITSIRESDDASLYIGDSEFLVMSASLE